MNSKTYFGWASSVRKLGKLVFIALRRNNTTIQVVIEPKHSNAFKVAQTVNIEDVLQIQGEEIKDAKGKLELHAFEVQIINKSKPLPININDIENLSEEVNYKYRYLVTRTKKLHNNLVLRSKLLYTIHNYLSSLEFTQVETPTLTKATPEGARDYLVPSRVHKGKCYALPQSPQMFKQLLMVGGIDKYYQIAKCFRDEDLRSDRQPEFTQLDIEMSFIQAQDIFDLINGLLKKLFLDIKGVTIDEIPFISYADAMQYYGTDKPDLRFDLKIAHLDVVPNVDVFKNTKRVAYLPIATALSRKQFDELAKKFTTEAVKIGFVKVDSNKEYQGSLSKALLNTDLPKNTYCLCAFGDDNAVLETLGKIRLIIANWQNLYTKEFAFTWVIDWPLFETSNHGITSSHHPFTSPNDKDLAKLDANPLDVKANAYDIVINGYEIGGGSIRINDSKVQHKIFELLKLDQNEISEKFGFFIKALEYGAPPHGGIALGIDRLAMILAKANSIKEVIAFPKTTSAHCPLTDAPGSMDAEKYDELGIQGK